MTDREFVLAKYPDARACTVTFTSRWCIQDYWPGGAVVSAAKKIMEGN